MKEEKAKKIQWLIANILHDTYNHVSEKQWGLRTEQRGEHLSDKMTPTAALSASSGRRFGYIIEMVLKMHSILYFTGIPVPKQGSFTSFKDLSSPQCACSRGGRRGVCLCYTLFTPCPFVGFAPTSTAKVRGEPSKTKLSYFTQHTVHIIDQVLS